MMMSITIGNQPTPWSQLNPLQICTKHMYKWSTVYLHKLIIYVLFSKQMKQIYLMANKLNKATGPARIRT